MSTSAPSAGPGTAASDRLESWKEIAVFLRRDIRTVQRWEKTEAMPVHRHVHDKLGSVYAFKSELLEWQRHRSGDLPDEAAEGEQSTVASELSASQDDERVEAEGRLFHWWYVLIAAVVVAAIATTVILIRMSTRDTAPAKILVLPFANLSGDASQEYFSDGVTEELITSLGRQSDAMRVTALGSSLAYKGSQKTARQIGRELKVDYVVSGSVRRSGTRVRISAHLMRTRDEAHLFDDSYDREITDILGLQSDVAAAITEGIRLRLPLRRGSPRVVNAEAYEAYLQGRFFWNKRTPEALHQAITYFEQSIADDANYAPAYVGLADSYLLLGSAQMGALAPRVAMPQAKAAVTKALELDPNLAEAHASLAHIKLIFEWDWAGAEAEFLRAIQLNPGYATAHQWYALYLNATGRTDEALRQLKTAGELDPLSPTIQAAIAEAYYFARRFDESTVAARRALEMNPDYALAYLLLGRSLEQQHHYDAALDAYHHGGELSGHAPALTMYMAHVYAAKGDLAASRKLLRELESVVAKPDGPYISSLYIGTVYTSLGDFDSAFRYFNKAAEERCEYLIYVPREPMADPLRSDPRLEQFLNRNGLMPPHAK